MEVGVYSAVLVNKYDGLRWSSFFFDLCADCGVSKQRLKLTSNPDPRHILESFMLDDHVQCAHKPRKELMILRKILYGVLSVGYGETLVREVSAVSTDVTQQPSRMTDFALHLRRIRALRDHIIPAEII